MKFTVLAAIFCLGFFTTAQIVSPISGDNNSLYFFMRVEWEPYNTAFLGKKSMDITLHGDNSESVKVTTNFPINENISSFDWIVYGLNPTTATKLTFTVDSDAPFDSDLFTVSLPGEATCTEERGACTDSLDCCSGDCTNRVCGDSVTCLHAGALCSSQFPCCNRGCNVNRKVCGTPPDCAFIEETCNENEDCCSDNCNTSTFKCEAPVSLA